MPSSTRDYRLAPRERKQGQQLYLQQMWAWGQDIRHPESNLLKRYGFDYRRDIPMGKAGSSCYSKSWQAQGQSYQLNLWSFGLVVGHVHAHILLERHAFRPKWMPQGPAEAISRPQDLPQLRQPKTREARQETQHILVQLCQEIARYEAWVLETVGPQWREKVFDHSPFKVRIPVLKMGPKWHTLAEQWQPAFKEYIQNA